MHALFLATLVSGAAGSAVYLLGDALDWPSWIERVGLPSVTAIWVFAAVTALGVFLRRIAIRLFDATLDYMRDNKRTNRRLARNSRQMAATMAQIERSLAQQNGALEGVRDDIRESHAKTVAAVAKLADAAAQRVIDDQRSRSKP